MLTFTSHALSIYHEGMSDEATKTPRQRAREETEARIVEIGNRMLDESGVEALSLRAVARELGIVSSAVYRYLKTRDELLTILIADAFNSLADAVDKAIAQDCSVNALGLAMLRWSREHPQRWALIYGTPIAAYSAPREVTVEPGTRVMVTLIRLVADLRARALAFEDRAAREAADGDGRRAPWDGVVPPTAGDGATAQPAPPEAQANPGLARLAEEIRTLGIDVDPEATSAAITVWVAIIGLISSLRFGQFGPGFDDVEDELMTSVVRQLGW